ncbi:putative NADH dehydrogenase [Choiromyces venosus 120613-1]|uniref:NADH dehydrogenase [ubiquinone] 1 beta subcomplex subunit 9 n=1 Tax=Choiromyces venosus 120613-1 TaxID=1336337 RepID=A0A3N4J9X4_9PEZI|nr:putative NADH dehydrogenase [Choiromyces venosus 120613-1]
MATTSVVKSLYRRSLKLSQDWCIRRDIWRSQALNIRELFEANREVKEPRQLRVILQEAEEALERWKHPDPYRAPTAPGGSKYERNIPPPIIDPPVPLH